MGKGSNRRPSFITDDQYRKNWLRVFGVKCPECDGSGHVELFNIANEPMGAEVCDVCNGDGYIKKDKQCKI